MNEITKSGTDYVGYEYKEITINSFLSSMYMDGYKSFGWKIDKNITPSKSMGIITLHLKRDRKIANKMELTRLQNNFEACMAEIETLEKSKATRGMIASVSVGLAGTVFMAGSTFAVTAEPPIIWLCILLAVPGFISWIIPFFINKSINKKRTQQIAPLIEKKQDEIYGLCKKGNSLL